MSAPDGVPLAARVPTPSARHAVGHAAEPVVVAGLVPLSTCDWPGRLVATVFLQGCPWSCTYCHNPGLIDPRTPGSVAWAHVRDLLARRHGLLDGVVFSGGEPTRQAGLVDAVREVREAGFGVGLHTAGAYPRRLAQVLPWVDWVGLDVKAPPGRYAEITGVPASARLALRSLRLVLDAGVPVQVRTTVDPTVLTSDDVAELTALLEGMGVRDHVLQEVRSTGTRPAYAEALAAARS
ncbi:anaerobic ribonucleoside-triphosphate reductase activating protein [Cellulomonas sp. APG4]|uniref:anaerobic ribonucleoside-triphosphate reductase activating protein n=1 Tax=Cellulomonas sp. APG4 TaxID=1538656 RepID=UPI00137AE786|nr:anaerobic ribonucleoside-triphosphate reductase activating protein [Cellulomonas sp. APG4]NCT92490.1 anaerobic ribonucleoside-triphosphate reductase activating protein [Cellulomonas sp. APG4]